MKSTTTPVALDCSLGSEDGVIVVVVLTYGELEEERKREKNLRYRAQNHGEVAHDGNLQRLFQPAYLVATPLVSATTILILREEATPPEQPLEGHNFRRACREGRTFPASSPTRAESMAPATSIPLDLATAAIAALPISFVAPLITTCEKAEKRRTLCSSFWPFFLQMQEQGTGRRRRGTLMEFWAGWTEQDMAERPAELLRLRLQSAARTVHPTAAIPGPRASPEEELVHRR